MHVKKKKDYQPPLLTIIEFYVEKGFVMSGTSMCPFIFEQDSEEDRSNGLHDYEWSDFQW